MMLNFKKNNLEPTASVENSLEFFLYNLVNELEPLRSIFAGEEKTKEEYFSFLEKEISEINIELNNKILELKQKFKKKDFINFFSELNFYYTNEEKEFFKEALENFWEEKFICSAFLLSGCSELMVRKTIILNEGKIYKTNTQNYSEYYTLGKLLKKNKKLLTKFFHKKDLERINIYIEWIFDNKGLNLRNEIMHLIDVKILFDKYTSNKLFHVLCFFLYFKKNKSVNKNSLQKSEY